MQYNGTAVLDHAEAPQVSQAGDDPAPSRTLARSRGRTPRP